MRQKFGDAVDGAIGDASEDVFKPGEISTRQKG